MGGGGGGMRMITSEAELLDKINDARRESKAAFGNDDMYMEKLIEEPRHIEIQVVGDSFGLHPNDDFNKSFISSRNEIFLIETPVGGNFFKPAQKQLKVFFFCSTGLPLARTRWV